MQKKPDAGPVAARDIRDAIEKVAAEVQRLQRDIQILAARLRVAEPEHFEPAPWLPEMLAGMTKRVPRDLAAAMIMLTAVRDHIRGAEQHLNAIRGHMDAIKVDAELISEFRE